MWRIGILSDVGVREGGVGSQMQGGRNMPDLYLVLIMKCLILCSILFVKRI